VIKLPEEINDIMKALAERGFRSYAVGGCVRDSIMGHRPLDWDIASNARLEDLKAIFPQAEVISEKYSVVRLDHSKCDDEGIIADIATFRKESGYSDARHPDEVEFVDDIQEDLKRRDFTVNAVAENPAEAVTDPFGGREDINAGIIRTVGDPSVRFAEDPIRMMRAVRIAAENDFDIKKNTYEAMLENAGRLIRANKGRIREELERMITAPYAGKGLRMLAGADMIPAVIGEQAVRLNRRQMERFSTLCDNIDKTKPVLLRRLGLFYSCFEEKKGLEAVKVLDYDKKTRQHLTDALILMEKLHFLRTGVELKRFLAEYGQERYEYLDNLAKAQRIVYDLDGAEIVARYEIMKDIKLRKEPIYTGDLAISGSDIVKEGIAEGEKVGQLLMLLTDVVHVKPDDNSRGVLLEYARRFSETDLRPKRER